MATLARSYFSCLNSCHLRRVSGSSRTATCTLIRGGSASSSRVLASRASSWLSDGNAAAKVMYGPLSDAAATLSERSQRTEEEARRRRLRDLAHKFGGNFSAILDPARKYAVRGHKFSKPKGRVSETGDGEELWAAHCSTTYYVPARSRVGKRRKMRKRGSLLLRPRPSSLSRHLLFSLDSDSASLKWQLGKVGDARARGLHSSSPPAKGIPPFPFAHCPHKSYRQ